MVKILFLGSGSGGNLKFIHSYFASSNVKVVGVITDRKCGALSYGEKNNIYSEVFSFDKSENSDKEISVIINKINPDIIITNINKILSESIVNEFSNKLINLHYSYLPAFKGLIGMKPVDMALALNNSFIGTTCHYVTEDVDSGKTICQGIFNHRRLNDIYQATFECGALTLVNGIFVHLNRSNLSEMKINDYLISPAANEIDVDLCNRIFKQLKNETSI